MMEISREQILQALAQVVDTQTGRPLVATEQVSGVVIRGGKIGLSVEMPLDMAGEDSAEDIRQRCEMAVTQLPGVERATVVLTAEASDASGAMPAPKNPGPPKAKASWQGQGLEGVRHIVAIASGKGGVGKSTTAVNLAVAAACSGLKVGLLDADIYGPSIPTLMDVHGQPEVREGKLLPLERYDIACMSMGFITGDDKPVVWRGSMTTKALTQMLRGVKWDEHGALDVLFIDMPPGTGDIHLTLAQSVPLSGAVMVSTPQEVALQDALKCLQTFRKLNVPVLGMVENMSYFADPATGEKHAIFGHGGAREAAERFHVPFLGEVPLVTAIRETGDAGHPLPIDQPEHAASGVYRDMVSAIMAALEESEQRSRVG